MDANAGSILPAKTGVHTRFSADVDAKASKSKAATSVPSRTNPKAQELRDSITGLSQAGPQPKEAVTSSSEPIQDASHSSSGGKRPREPDVLTISGDEPKPKKSKSKKSKKKQRRKKEQEAAAAKEAAAT